MLMLLTSVFGCDKTDDITNENKEEHAMSELPQAMRNSQLERAADDICDGIDEIFFKILDEELKRVRELELVRSMGSEALAGAAKA